MNSTLAGPPFGRRLVISRLISSIRRLVDQTLRRALSD
jgi:hypothetical protein